LFCPIERIMSKPLLSDRAIQIVAENKIRAAIEAGAFRNLPGFGRPAAVLDEPYDPFWWMCRKLKREQLVAVPWGASSNLSLRREP
jgi:hypothetical protein